MSDIEFFFDIGCPWTWATSRWMTEVQQAEDLSITWTTYSLRIKNAGKEVPAEIAERSDAQFAGMRVIEAARHRLGDEVVPRLYTELGARIHHDGDTMLNDLEGALATLSLPADLIEAADEDRWDETLEANTNRGRSLVGDDVGVPIIRIGKNAMFGPVLSPAPHGDDATRLWDAYATLLTMDGVWEIKRTRKVGPIHAARPSAS